MLSYEKVLSPSLPMLEHPTYANEKVICLSPLCDILSYFSQIFSMCLPYENVLRPPSLYISARHFLIYSAHVLKSLVIFRNNHKGYQKTVMAKLNVRQQ